MAGDSCKSFVDHIDVGIDEVPKSESSLEVVTDNLSCVCNDVLCPDSFPSSDSPIPQYCHFPCVSPIEFFVDPCGLGEANCYSWQVSCLDNTGVVINYSGTSDPTNTTINLQVDTTSDASLSIVSYDNPSTSLVLPL